MSTLRILLIDGDLALAGLLTSRLELEGYRVVHAPDGIQGLELLNSADFDLILLDYQVPVLNGLEVLARLVACAAPPVIMLSAISDHQIVVQAMKLGASDYIIKVPGDEPPTLLLRAIEQALERFSLRAALSISTRKLEENEEMFRTITENTVDITVLMDKEHRFTYVSPAFEKLTGFSRAQTAGMTPRRFIHPDDFSKLFKAVQLAWQHPGESIHTADFRGYDRDGQEHHFIGNLTAMPDKVGVCGLVVHCRDITQRIAAEQELVAAKARAELYLNSAGALILVLDPEGRVQLINQYGCRLLGISEQDVLGKRWLKHFVPEAQAEPQSALYTRLFAGDIQAVEQFEGHVFGRDGLTRAFTWSIQPLHEQQGVGQILLSGVDITQRKQTEADLAKSEERYGLATRAAKVGVWDWDLRANTMYIDPNLKMTLGFEDNEIPNRPEAWRARIYGEDQEKVYQVINECITGRSRRCEVEHRMVCKDNSERWFLTRARPGLDEKGRVVRLTGTDTDITDLKYAEMQVEHMATHDFLTGLPNRILLMDRLAIAMAHARRTGMLISVLFIDLDGFKPVNDTYGHDAGDEVLRQIALRLQRGFRATDTVARFGGDEFVVILTQLLSLENLATIAQKLLDAIEEPLDLDSQNCACVSASMGISIYPADGETGDGLIKAADGAMYRAKRAGKHRFAYASSGEFVSSDENAANLRTLH